MMEIKRLTVVSFSGAGNTGKYSDVVARQYIHDVFPAKISFWQSEQFHNLKTGTN